MGKTRVSYHILLCEGSDYSAEHVIALLGRTCFYWSGGKIPHLNSWNVCTMLGDSQCVYPSSVWPLQIHNIIVGGDFNTILDNTKDTNNPLGYAPPDLALWADTFDLQEIWRWKHLEDWTYSHISASHRSGSRIDLFFGSASALSQVGAVSYLPASLSDHSPLELGLTLGTSLEPGILEASIPLDRQSSNTGVSRAQTHKILDT